MAVFANFFERGGFAEAGNIRVIACFCLAAPGVIGFGNFPDFFVGEFAPGAVYQHAHLAGVDKEHLPAPIAQFVFQHKAIAAVFSQDPQTSRNLCGVKKLPRQRHHAIHDSCSIGGFEHGLADIAFAGLVGAHRAIGQHHARHATGSQVVVDVLQPCVVGVTHGWHAELPAHVVAQAVAAPVGDIEGRVGEDVVGLEVAQFVLVEAALVVPSNVGVDPAHSQVHLGQSPRGVVRLLPVNCNVAYAAAVLLHELFRLNEHSARAAAGVVNTA